MPIIVLFIVYSSAHVDAEYAALLVQLAENVCSHCSLPVEKVLFPYKPAHDFLIRILDAAEVAAEAVLVELLVGLDVPEAAGVGAYLVGEDDGPVAQAAELELEVHKLDAVLEQQRLEQLVYEEGVALDGLYLLRRGELESQGVVGVYERVAQLVVLVGELYGRRVKGDALLDAVALREAAGGDVADDDLERHDGDLLYQGLALGELLDEVGGDAVLLEHAHEAVGEAVVDHALAHDGAALFAVEGRGVILIVNYAEVRIVGGKDLLGLTLVELFALFHVSSSPFQAFRAGRGPFQAWRPPCPGAWRRGARPVHRRIWQASGRLGGRRSAPRLWRRWPPGCRRASARWRAARPVRRAWIYWISNLGP